MKRFRRLLEKVLLLPVIYIILMTILSVFLLRFIFINQKIHTMCAYMIYFFSAYTLTVVAVAILNKIIVINRSINRNLFFNRYHTDLIFKAKISLYISLSINLLYSLYRIIAGIYYHSVWFGTVAFYYIILSIERFLLLHHVRKKEKTYVLELKRYCLCGYLLFVLTVTVVIMSIYMMDEEQVIAYPGHTIYAIAGYTFYNLILAIINIVKYRKLENPIYHASKMITLATALVSLLSLQAAMLAEFGKNSIQQKMMKILTGLAVFVIIISISLYMIIRGKRLLRNNSKNNNL